MTRLDLLVDVLNNQADRGGQIQSLGGRQDLLAGGLHDAVASARSRHTIDALRSCADAAGSEHFANSLSPEVHPAAAGRVCARIRAAISSAQAAVWAARLPLDGGAAWQGMVRGMAEAERRLTGTELDPGLPEPEVWIAEAATAVDAACQAWRTLDQNPSWAEEWALGLLHADQRWRLRVPVAFALDTVRALLPGAQEKHDGFIAEWSIRRGRPGSRGLIEAPSLALWQLDASLLETIRKQWQLAGAAPAVWTVTSEATTPDRCGLLTGSSLGGAVRVGFELQARHDRPDFESDLLILAAVSESEPTRLTAVDGIANKLAAAERSGRIRRVLLARDTPIDTRPMSGTGRLEALAADTVDEAVEHASGTVMALRRHLARMVAMPDEVGRTLPYTGRRQLTKVNVPMDVLKYEPRLERESRRMDDEEGRTGRDRASDKSTRAGAVDFGEWPYQVAREDVERRLPWSQVWREAGPGGSAIEVVIGASGQGKSQLTRMTVHDIADEGLRRLGQQGTTVDDLDIPVLLQCQALAKAVGEARDLADAVADAVAGTIGGSSRENQAAFQHVRTRLTASQTDPRRTGRGRVWLVLDAYDQVGSTHLPIMGRCLSLLATWPCRVILTSRPAAYNARSWGRGQDDSSAPALRTVEYRLAPFSDAQADTFVGLWFADQADERREMTRLLRESTAVREMSHTPFLLTLLSWTSEDRRQRVSADITRTQLYERVIRQMLSLKRERDGAQEGFVRDDERPNKILPWVGLSILRAYDELVRTGTISQERLLDEAVAAKKILDGRVPSEMSADALIDELSDKRILSRAADSDVPVYEFAHRSIAEWLTAYGLSLRLKGKVP
jgi:hypothetical protein